MAKPKEGAERKRASALRSKLNAGKPVSEADAKWLQHYERSRDESGPAASTPPLDLQPVAAAVEAGQDVGASEEGRTVKFELKEQKRAVGTGDAASVAAGLAMMSKAQAEALKGVADANMAALKVLTRAVKTYRSMTLDLREGMRDLLQSELQSREKYREHYLERVNVEAKLKSLAAERADDDPVGQLLREAAAHVMQHGFGGTAVGKINGAPKGPKASG